MTDNKITTYKRDDVKKATLEYFNNDELATDVWINKYSLKNSDEYYELTPDDTHKRIAKELSRIENKYPNPLSEEHIYNTLKNFKRIIPQGSPMSGIGNDFQVVSLGNCFVIGNNADSYGGILKIDEEQAQLMKRRGGVGHDLSKIRPESSPVKNSAITSTGIVPFMERYSNSTKETAQSGRRGALMLSISIKHPDAESFIDAKLKEGKITGANISIKITNEFMDAVINDKPFIQKYPIDSDNPMIIKEINAKNLWEKIVNNAWKSAEPGILFWDNIINESISSCYGDDWIETSTNPCVSKDTLILTDLGYYEIKDKINQKVNIWNGKEFSEVIPIITGYNQKMLKVTFSDGSELKCTDYHKHYIWNGFSRDGNVIEKDAKDLIVGDKLEKFEFPILDFNKKVSLNNKLYYTLGLFAGDGHLKRNKPFISLFGEKKKLVNEISIVGNISENLENDKLTVGLELPIMPIKYDEVKTYVPSIDTSLNDVLSWLSGLIDSNGSRNSEEGSVSISSINKEFLMKVKLYVLNMLGINGSVIDENDGGLKKIKGREYLTNKSYRLIISAYNIKKLYELGLHTHRVKIDNVDPNRDADRFITVKSIKRIEDAEKVYCFKEEKRGRGCFNGIVTGQCGELPLPPYDSCRLLCLNLYGYVVNPFKNNSYFNWKLFKNDVCDAQRYMDDIIDLEIEKIDKILKKINSDPEDYEIKVTEKKLWEKIRDNAIKGRRTGLGITAEGDMLAALGYKYGDDKAINFSEQVHKTLKLEAYKSSINLAKERGTFPIYDNNKEKNNPFLNRIKNENSDLYNDMIKYGRRNISLLTIAPTGSISILTQTTSGIEPVFLPIYKRKKKVYPQEKNIKIDFVDDEGVSWQEYTIFHHKFKDWLIINGYDIEEINNLDVNEINEIIKKSPYYEATSNDLDWIKKIKMQGKIQKHVDHSISTTTNIPSNSTKELVGEIYKAGWLANCKGVTVYRDGSRSGVLVNNNDKEMILIDHHAPKRPKRLKAHIIRFQNNLEKWVAVVGLMDNRPYEIFTGKVENGLSDLPASITECEIVKNIYDDSNGDRRKRYDIEYIDNNNEKHIHTGLNSTFNSEYWNYAKLISSILRHGMPIVYVYEIINSLNLRDDFLNTWKNGVARVIKRYIKNGEKIKEMCPECKNTEFVFEEGCIRCSNCSWSKCS